MVDGQPRFGCVHRYQRRSAGRRATAGGGAYHTATLTVVGDSAVVTRVTAVARAMKVCVTVEECICG